MLKTNMAVGEENVKLLVHPNSDCTTFERATYEMINKTVISRRNVEGAKRQQRVYKFINVDPGKKRIPIPRKKGIPIVLKPPCTIVNDLIVNKPSTLSRMSAVEPNQEKAGESSKKNVNVLEKNAMKTIKKTFQLVRQPCASQTPVLKLATNDAQPVQTEKNRARMSQGTEERNNVAGSKTIVLGPTSVINSPQPTAATETLHSDLSTSVSLSRIRKRKISMVEKHNDLSIETTPTENSNSSISSCCSSSSSSISIIGGGEYNNNDTASTSSETSDYVYDCEVFKKRLKIDPRKRFYDDWKNSTKEDANSNIPLHYEIMANNEPRTRQQAIILRSQLRNINHQDKNGRTALMIAASMTRSDFDPKIIRTLLSYGADIMLKDNSGNTALHLGARHASTDTFRALMEAPNVDKIIDDLNDEGFAAIHVCALANRHEIITVLADEANLNIKDGKSGRTGLFHALESKCVLATRTLIGLGASVMEPSYSGQLPVNVTGNVALAFEPPESIDTD